MAAGQVETDTDHMDGPEGNRLIRRFYTIYNCYYQKKSIQVGAAAMAVGQDQIPERTDKLKAWGQQYHWLGKQVQESQCRKLIIKNKNRAN